MKNKLGYFSTLIFFTFLLLFLSGCQPDKPACPPIVGTPRYMTTQMELTVTPGPLPTPATIKIGGRTMTVDKIVEGPLCNDTWSGTVYVTCNVQVYEWVDKPTFLKDCALSIAPDTVVYVAYHNDTAYYDGCSCHTGEIAEP